MLTNQIQHFTNACCTYILPDKNEKSKYFCDGPLSVVRASVCAPTISLNKISSETTYWILTKPHRNDSWVVPYQSCSNRSSWLHT